MAGCVARVYAEAWYEAVLDTGNIKRMERVRREGEMVLDLLKRYPDWLELLKTPRLSAEEKEKLLEQALGGCTADGDAVDEVLQNLLKLLVKNRHADEAAAVLRQGIIYCKKSCGIGSAVVTSAAKLREDQKERVKEQLLAVTGCREIEIAYACDESLIGGLMICMENRLADGSVRGMLRRLTGALRKVL